MVTLGDSCNKVLKLENDFGDQLVTCYNFLNN